MLQYSLQGRRLAVKVEVPDFQSQQSVVFEEAAPLAFLLEVMPVGVAQWQ